MRKETSLGGDVSLSSYPGEFILYPCTCDIKFPEYEKPLAISN